MLHAIDIVTVQPEVVGGVGLIVGGHDSPPILRVAQTQAVTNLVSGYRQKAAAG